VFHKGLKMVLSTMKKLAVALALATAVLGVNVALAAPSQYNLGTLTTTVGKSDISFDQGFSDQFYFVAGKQTGALSSLVGFVFEGDLLAQYRFGSGTTPSWSDWANIASPTNAETGAFSFTKTFGGLQAGKTYWLAVQDVNSGSGGKYSVTLAPVPEPESFVMLLGGLGLIGTIARRRQNKQTNAMGV
jgi:hypothetical protein